MGDSERSAQDAELIASMCHPGYIPSPWMKAFIDTVVEAYQVSGDILRNDVEQIRVECNVSL